MRRTLVTIVLLSVAGGLIMLSAGFYTVLSMGLERSADAVLAARADAVIATLSSSAGQLVIHDTPADDVLDAGVWVADAAGHPVLRAPAPESVQTVVGRLLAAGRTVTRDVGQTTRLAARPFTLGSGVSGTVVISLSRLPFEQTEHDALVAMVVFGVVILVVVSVGSLVVVRLALRPVTRMTAQAEDWSDHDPDRRSGMGPPRDEFTRLAATLDGLLGRVAAALRREQRLTAEIAHELRTPLARAWSATWRRPAGPSTRCWWPHGRMPTRLPASATRGMRRRRPWPNVRRFRGPTGCAGTWMPAMRCHSRAATNRTSSGRWRPSSAMPQDTRERPCAWKSSPWAEIWSSG